MHFQITLTSDNVARYSLVPFSGLRDYRAKRKEKEERKKNPW